MKRFLFLAITMLARVGFSQSHDFSNTTCRTQLFGGGSSYFLTDFRTHPEMNSNPDLLGRYQVLQASLINTYTRQTLTLDCSHYIKPVRPHAPGNLPDDELLCLTRTATQNLRVRITRGNFAAASLKIYEREKDSLENEVLMSCEDKISATLGKRCQEDHQCSTGESCREIGMHAVFVCQK